PRRRRPDPALFRCRGRRRRRQCRRLHGFGTRARRRGAFAVNGGERSRRQGRGISARVRPVGLSGVRAENEPKAWAWIRERDALPPGPGVITGYDKVIHVPVLKLALPLGAVFAGVETT